MSKITVLLADDHNLVRTALRRVLETTADIEVIGEAENGHQCLSEAKRLHPNLVLLDLAMPKLNGIETTRQICRDLPFTKVLILSTYSDSDHVQKSVQSGAAGYLLKQTAADDVIEAIRQIQSGSAFFSPGIAAHLLARTSSSGSNDHSPADKTANLTIREAEILQLIAEGYASKQIADILSIAIKTTEKHRQSLMQKLNLHNIASLTRYAFSTGVIESRVLRSDALVGTRAA